MFKDSLTRRRQPAFKGAFPCIEIILVLGNASYHHGYDPEVRVPETNTQAYNTDMPRQYKANGVTVLWSGVAHRFEVPRSRSFSNANTKGVGRCQW